MSEINNGVEMLTATGGGQAMMAPGGGLSGGKLALATAEAGDVLAGKTYYAGDKELKTGTLALADATATAADVASGKTFYSGDKTIKTGTGKIKVTTKKVYFDKPGDVSGTETRTVSFAELGLTEKPTVVLGFEYSYGHDRTISIQSYTLTNTSITIVCNFSGGGWGSSNVIVSIITFG